MSEVRLECGTRTGLDSTEVIDLESGAGLAVVSARLLALAGFGALCGCSPLP